MWQRFKEWWCRKFGHRFSDMEALVFEIKYTSYRDFGTPYPEPKIRCCCCGSRFTFTELEKIDKGGEV